ncbi:MAG: 23S rRNA (pseudouridine(1915)-N(3))-methyltransferase RlmH [Alphaproteobacteria bacterium]
MRVTVCAVGRLKSGPERDLVDKFAKRITWPFDIREVEERRKLPDSERRQREGELLSAACPDDGVRIVLDERGKSLKSAEMAQKIGEWRDSGRDIAFLIGGADGLAPEIRDSADFVLSFGAQTWPHMLVRALLVEQIYRAQEILAGHPYHRA